MAEKFLTTYNQEDLNTHIGFFKTLKRVNDIKEERCIPVIVTKVYDEGENEGLIDVRPIIQKTYRDNRNNIVHKDREEFTVRPLKIAQGGCIINIPTFVGDTGWVLAGDRDAEDAIDSNDELNTKDKEEDELEECTYPANSSEILKYEYGFFIPSGWYRRINDSDLKDRFALIVADEEGKHSGSVSISREGMTYVKGKDENGKEFEAYIQDTNIVTEYDKENKCLKTWKGKVLRTDGEEGESINIDASVEGWTGEVREVTDIKYANGIMDCLYITKKYENGVLKKVVEDKNRTVIFTAVMHLPEEY